MGRKSILPPEAAQPMKLHVGELRRLLFEAEKVCQALSSAVNTSSLPAGAWIYVDVVRMSVLASMRSAQLLELELLRLAPPPPAEKGS